MMKFLQEKLFKKLLVIALVMMGGVMWGQTAYTLNHAFGGASGVPTGIQVVSYNGSTSCSTSSNGANAVTTLVLKAMPGYQFTITSVTGTGVRSNAGANMFQFQLVNGSSTVNGTDTSVGASSSCSGGGTISPLSFAANEQVVTENNTVSIKIARHPNGTSGGGYSHVKTLAIQGIVSPTLPQFNLQGSSLAFADVCLEQPENGYFTFTGDNFSTNATVQVGALAGFSYSLTQEGTYEETLTIPNYNGEEITVWVNFTPTAMSNYSGNIPLSALAPDEEAELDIPVTGQGSLPDSPVADAQDFCGAATVADLLPVSPEADTFTENFSSEAGTGVNANEDIAFSLGTWHFKNIAVADSQELIFYSTVPANAHILTPAFNGIQSITFDGLSQGAGVSNLKVIKVIDGAETVVTTVELQPGSIGDPSTYDSYTVDINDASSNIQIKFVSSDVPAESGYYEIIKNLNFTGYPEYTYNWYDAETGGTALASDSVLATGTYYVSQTVGTCESLRTAVEVTANDIPAAPTADAQLFCGSGTVADLTLTSPAGTQAPITENFADTPDTANNKLANGEELSSGVWGVTSTSNIVNLTGGLTINQSGGAAGSEDVQSINLTATPANSTTAIISPAFNGLNSVSFYSKSAYNTLDTPHVVSVYKIVDGAETLLDQVTPPAYLGTVGGPWQLFEIPVNDDSENIQIKIQSTYTGDGGLYIDNITFTFPESDDIINWYDVETGGTALAEDTDLATGTYYASQIVNGCESARTAVAVTVNPIPAAPTAATVQEFCGATTLADVVVTGSNITWYDAPTGGSAVANNTVLTEGTSLYYAAQIVDGCESAERIAIAVAVTITPVPQVENLMLCGASTVADLTVISGTNVQWYNVATGGTPLAVDAAVTAGTYYASQTVNGCESSRAAVTVTINPIPVVPTADAQSFCGSATVADLTATGTSVFQTIFNDTFNNLNNWNAINLLGNTVWATSSNGNPANAPYVAINGFNVNNEDWLVSNPIAISADAIGATLKFITASNYSGPNLQVFYTTNYTGDVNTTDWQTLSPTLSSGGWAWVNSGDLDISDAVGSNLVVGFKYTSSAVTNGAKAWEIDNFQVIAEYQYLNWYDMGGNELTDTDALSTGTYNVTQTINGCESEPTAVAITVNPIPAAPVAEAQMFCGAATIADIAVTMEGTATWYADADATIQLPTDVSIATTTYYVSQTINGCEGEVAAVAVTVNPIPAAPVAEAQMFCGLTTVADLVATGENLMWYDVETGGVALLDGLVVTTGTYYVSQTVNGCVSPRTMVEVTVNEIPVAPIADAQMFCGTATVADLAVNMGENVMWYDVATGGTALATDAALATGTYYVSQTVNNCESPRAMVAVTVNEIPAAPTANAQLFCGSAIVAEIAVTTGENVMWYNVATGGTALAANTALATGTYYVSQTVNGCESERTAVEIAVNPIPAAPTADAMLFCGSATAAELTATTEGAAIWYADATTTTTLAVDAELSTGLYYVSQIVGGCESTRTAVSVTVNEIPAAPVAEAQLFCGSAVASELMATTVGAPIWYADETTTTPLAANAELATGTYYVSQIVNGCESARTMVEVTVNEIPVAPTADDFTFCGSATVADLSVTSGEMPMWYATETGGEALAMNTALSTGMYYVSQTVNGCESPRAMVEVTVNEIPAAPTAEGLQTFCNAATVSNIAVTGENITWYDALVGGSMVDGDMALTEGTSVYYASQTVNGCEGARVAVAVVLNVTPAPASADFAFCNAATVADLDVTTTGTPQWYDVEVDGEPLAMNAALATGTYYLTQTINGCESARVAVNVVVTVVASPVGEATQEFVAGETIADLEVEGNNVMWYSDAELTVMIETTTVLVDGTTYYAVSNDGDCASEVLAVTVEEVLKTDVVTDTKFTHYPNPVVDVLNIEFKENITSVTVYNVLGQMVMERTVNATNVQVNMSTLSAGTYIVRAATDNKSTSFKVVKN